MSKENVNENTETIEEVVEPTAPVSEENVEVAVDDTIPTESIPEEKSVEGETTETSDEKKGQFEKPIEERFQQRLERERKKLAKQYAEKTAEFEKAQKPASLDIQTFIDPMTGTPVATDDPRYEDLKKRQESDRLVEYNRQIILQQQENSQLADNYKVQLQKVEEGNSKAAQALAAANFLYRDDCYHLAKEMAQYENGVEVVSRYVLENPHEAGGLARLSPEQQIRFVAQLVTEAKYKKVPPKLTSNTPPPADNFKSSNGGLPKSVLDMSYKELKQKQEAEKAARWTPK